MTATKMGPSLFVIPVSDFVKAGEDLANGKKRKRG
jgi:hypothetical protein